MGVSLARQLALALATLALLPAAARAQESKVAQQDAPSASVRERGDAARDVARFLAGGILGLAVHESGHVTSAFLFGANPGLGRVSFSGIPFFAITHDGDLSARREYVVSSAGFWMHQLGSEWLLTRRPGLRGERAPALKGMLAFNILLGAGYAATAVAHVGPPERDTRSMAASLRVNEAWVGGMVLAPAALDAWRYYHPDSRWAAWASRAAKAGLVAAALRR